jgi:hypothetical protein
MHERRSRKLTAGMGPKAAIRGTGNGQTQQKIFFMLRKTE